MISAQRGMGFEPKWTHSDSRGIEGIADVHIHANFHITMPATPHLVYRVYCKNTTINDYRFNELLTCYK